MGRPPRVELGLDVGSCPAWRDASCEAASGSHGRTVANNIPRAACSRRCSTEPAALQTFDDSLRRCGANGAFFDRFYERFLASSPKVREKFSGTDFVRQKRALRASLHLILVAAHDPERDAARFLGPVAERHSSRQLGIGAELYDLWLDSLLATVRELDPEFSPAVEQAWEDVMAVGIRFMSSRY